MQYMKEKKESSGLEPGVVPSPIEQQYVLDEYDVVKGPLMVSTARAVLGLYDCVIRIDMHEYAYSYLGDNKSEIRKY
jgi:hypothetical protein